MKKSPLLPVLLLCAHVGQVDTFIPSQSSYATTFRRSFASAQRQDDTQTCRSRLDHHRTLAACPGAIVIKRRSAAETWSMDVDSSKILFMTPSLLVIDKPFGVRMDGDYESTVEKLVKQVGFQTCSHSDVPCGSPSTSIWPAKFFPFFISFD